MGLHIMKDQYLYLVSIMRRHRTIRSDSLGFFSYELMVVRIVVKWLPD